MVDPRLHTHKDPALHFTTWTPLTVKMSLPVPSVPLNNHCSVIYNETLYAYQSNAFQSLSLRNGSLWNQLPMGVSLNGATCVQGVADGDDALFVIGGAANASSQSYSGLQIYNFQDRKWTTASPQMMVTQNRLDHGSTYLNSTSSILIYGGFQNGIYLPTSETFTISTQSPHLVKSFPSTAPPVTQPIVLPWNSSHAVLLGGTPENREVWLFSEAYGWGQLDITLPIDLQNISAVQAAIINTADGMNILEIFDESVSPNQISTFTLQGANSQSFLDSGASTSIWSSMSTSETQQSTTGQRRDVTLSDLPPYNSSLAPKATRNGFSLAQDPSGLVIISGGNNQQPLAIFNQTGNQWVDAAQFFDTPSPTTPFPSESVTAEPTSITSTTSPPNPSSARDHRLLIVGAVLGAVFGTAALLVAILILLRILRQRRNKNYKGRTSRYPSNPKQMDFASPGAEFTSSVGGSFGRSNHNASNSVQTAAPYVPRGSQQTKRGLFHKSGDSNGSAKSFFNRSKSPLISSPIPEPTLHATSPDRPEQILLDAPSPEPRTEPRTDEGWSKYFANNNTATHHPSAYTHYEPASRPTTYTSTSQSDYTNASRVPSSHPHESAEVPPLNFRGSQYPTTDPSQETSHVLLPFSFPHPGTSHNRNEDPEPPTPSTLFTHLPEEDEYLNESSGQESWTPVATSDRGSTWERPPSSVFYAENTTTPHPGERVRIPNFPGVPNSNRTSQTTVVHKDDERGLRSTAAKDFAGGISRPSGKQVADDATQSSGSISEDASSRSFLRGPHQDPRPQRLERTEEDMSWLSLR